MGIFTPTIGGVFGYVDADDETLTASYAYWNASIALAVDKFTFDFRYWDTDSDGEALFGGLADERFVFTAKVALP